MGRKIKLQFRCKLEKTGHVRVFTTLRIDASGWDASQTLETLCAMCLSGLCFVDIVREWGYSGQCVRRNIKDIWTPTNDQDIS